jgi:hypothetical protein
MERGYLGEVDYSNEGRAYQTAIVRQDPALADTIAATALPGEDWLSAAFRVANSALLAESQRRLLKVQIERAKAGMQPLDASQYGLGVNVGLSPQTIKLLGLGAAALVVVYLISRKR